MSAPTNVERWLANPWPLRGAEPEDDPADEGAEEQEQPEATGKRAARQRAEAAEARATAAEQRVERLQRAEVERIAAQVLSVGADVFSVDLGGAALSDLLDPDTGDVDPDAVRETAQAVLDARPGLRAQRRSTLTSSPDGGARTPAPRRASWSDVIGAGR